MKIDWNRVFSLTLWIVQGCLALRFLYSGASKFGSHTAFWITLFNRIGFGQWFRYFIGILEVVCAVLLLIPRTTAVAAGLLGVTMAGAVLTHLFVVRDGYASFFPAFPLLLLIIIGLKRT